MRVIPYGIYSLYYPRGLGRNDTYTPLFLIFFDNKPQTYLIKHSVFVSCFEVFKGWKKSSLTG